MSPRSLRVRAGGLPAVRQRRRGPARGVAGVLAALVALAVLGTGVPPAHAAGTPTVRGSGSSYVGQAMDQWQMEAANEVKVNYTPTGSPDGLSAYSQSTIDFAGTEGEFESFGQADRLRGYQYVPDVAGGIALLYNIEDKAGNKVDYLHLSRETVAGIFLGKITTWADERIRVDNISPRLPNGISLPDRPVSIAYRNKSGTTALFYDFIANIDPAGFAEVRARNAWSTDRPGSLENHAGGESFSNSTQYLSSDQMAQGIRGPQGKWSIGYDEVSYAIAYDVPYAYIRNASGKFVRPFALNVSTALEDAHLRPDLSQELSQVYASGRPDAYPISAYSYAVTQCAAAGDRPTCVRRYGDPSVEQGLTSFLRHIACNGQVNMARIGYSPLPPNLSQEVVNSIARMQGTQPEQLSPGNCANPRFHGSLGVGSTPGCDPLWDCPESQGGPGGGAGGGPGGAGGGAAGGAAGAGAGGAGSEAGTGADGTGTGTDGTTDAKRARSAGGGSAADEWRKANPVAYTRPAVVPVTLWPFWALLAIVVLPPLVGGVSTWRSRSRDAAGP
jgi:phosphate transport system substrate-binding protein